jgi:DNA-binding transcriptional LysR family regulator
MRTFVKVVELGSFSAAARQANLSPAMITKQIAHLEGRIGARLLNRSTRQLSTTEPGQAYFERCLDILSRIEEAEAEAGLDARDARGTLRITAPAEFGNMHLSVAIARFQTLYPEIELFLDFSNHQADLVQESYDVAVRVARSLDTSLVGRRIATSHFRAVASPAYVAAHGAPAVPEDLNAHRCVTFGVPSPWLNWRFARGAEVTEVRIKPRVLSTSAEALLQSARASAGIAVLPTFVCGGDLARGDLMPLLAAYDIGALGIFVLYPHRRLIPRRTRLFVDHLLSEIGEDPEHDPWAGGGRAD